MTIQTHPQVIIETEVTDEQRAIFENFHCSVEAFPTLTELRTRVFELLKEGEELELDYPVYVLREGCWEEYYEKVVSVELIDEGSLQCNCECCDILVNELTEEEQEEVFQNIIDKLEQDDE